MSHENKSTLYNELGFVERTHSPSEMGSLFFCQKTNRDFMKPRKAASPGRSCFLVAEIVMGFWLDWFFEGLSYLGEKYSYLGFCQYLWTVLEMCFYSLNQVMIEMRMDTFFFTLLQMYHIKAGNEVRHYSKGKVCFYWVAELRSNPRMVRKLCFRGHRAPNRGDFQGPISCWLLLHLDLFEVMFYFLPW